MLFVVRDETESYFIWKLCHNKKEASLKGALYVMMCFYMNSSFFKFAPTETLNDNHYLCIIVVIYVVALFESNLLMGHPWDLLMFSQINFFCPNTMSHRLFNKQLNLDGKGNYTHKVTNYIISFDCNVHLQSKAFQTFTIIIFFFWWCLYICTSPPSNPQYSYILNTH